VNADKLFNVLGAIVGVALVTTLVSHTQTKNVIGALGSAFSGSIKAAVGTPS
jgi:fucose permease